MSTNFGKMLTPSPVTWVHFPFQGSSGLLCREPRNTTRRCWLESEASRMWHYGLAYFGFQMKWGKNDRNGPYTFIFMNVLNFMGMPNHELCSNWGLGLILAIGV